MKKVKTFLILILITNIFLISKESIKIGIYVHPKTVLLENHEKIAEEFLKQKITDVFLLVKGEAGATLFPSEYTYCKLYSVKDCDINKMLKGFLNELHRRNIRVHAWFIVSSDGYFLKNHPGAEVFHVKKPNVFDFNYPVIKKPFVNLSSCGYKEYFFNHLKDAIKYEFDGIMLDKIRYTHLAYTFDDYHISKALRSGVDVKKVINSAVKTLYGKEDEKEDFLYSYRDEDKDIFSWVKIRKEEIESFVRETKKICKNKNLTLSASFMPEGAYDEVFGDTYYGQNYKELSKYLDFFVIMAYFKDFSMHPSWISMVTSNAKLRANSKVWTAIQSYGDISGKDIENQVFYSKISKPQGIAIFKYPEIKKYWINFRKALNSKKKVKIYKGIIFKGKGTIRNCWKKSFLSLINGNSSKSIIIPYIVDEKFFKDYSNLENMDFILIPGGGGSSIAKALRKKGLLNIKKFVKNGGGYIGICAGAFLPLKGYWNNETKYLEIVNGEPFDVDHWNRGSKKVKLRIKRKHYVFHGLNKQIFELNYYSGPVIVRSNLKLKHYKELAVFEDEVNENGAKPGMKGKTAILEAKYGKGKIILFSPHPELTDKMGWMLRRAVIYVSK